MNLNQLYYKSPVYKESGVKVTLLNLTESLYCQWSDNITSATAGLLPAGAATASWLRSHLRPSHKTSPPFLDRCPGGGGRSSNKNDRDSADRYLLGIGSAHISGNGDTRRRGNADCASRTGKGELSRHAGAGDSLTVCTFYVQLVLASRGRKFLSDLPTLACKHPLTPLGAPLASA